MIQILQIYTIFCDLIIGLKKYLRQNFKLKELAKQKKIPIYSFNQISIYQLTKFIKMINEK